MSHEVILETFIDEREVGIGDWVDINPNTFTGTVNGSSVRGGTDVIGGYRFEVNICGVDACFFSEAADEAEEPTGDPPFPPVWPYLFSSGEIYGRDHLSVNQKMIRRDNYSFEIAVVLNGEPVDLTGCSLTMTAKYSVTDLDASAVFTRSTSTSGITITDATGGIALVEIVTSNTTALPLHLVNLVYDIEMIDASAKRYTVLSGILSVYPDVSSANP